jgi:hypothetical protein
MGWLIAIVLLITGCIRGNDAVVVASALFAIAGAIETLRDSK